MGGLHPPHPPGYHNGPGSKVAVNVTDSCRSEVLSKELVTSLILIVEIMKRAEMGWNRIWLEVSENEVNMTWWGGIGFNPVQSISSNFGYISTPGGTHIFGRTRMYRSNGSLFYKKSLTMGPVFFTPKILKHGSTFLTEPQITRNFWKIGLFLKKNP